VIYICVPAHNEEQTVGVVLWKVRQVMAELGRDYQLLVADDGSTDRTPSVLEPYTRVLPLTVLRNESRRGYAAALEMLLREAVRRSEYPRRDAVVVLQADFSEDPEHVATLIRRLESGADIVASNAVYGEPQPRRAYRWGRALLNRLLRRFSWPEGARDPVTGLNAYRVMCVKGALDSRPDDRLLHHEGWAANAELLRAAAPTARRIETLELELRRDRLQRSERFHFGTVFREVLAFVRGRAGAPRPVDQLAADIVLGGRSQLRALTAEGLREQGYANGVEPEPRRRRSGGGGRRGGEGKGDARRTRSEPARAAGRPAKATTEQGERGPRRKKRPRPAPAEASVNGAAAPDEAAGPAARPKSRRRSRSGGSKGRQQGAPAGGPQGTPEATDTTTADGEATEAAVAVTAEDAGQDAGQASRKRRRGSRGGRRRKRGPRSAAGGDDVNANSNETPSPPDAEQAG
jgi:Glycosyl transferase family 2